MSLDKYWEKRNFQQTPEPRGKPVTTNSAVAKNGLRYFIQRHHARALHYDFRLELGGTLKSWAVPKGPSLDPADKRLAVHVEDHPLAYGSFEGTIPAGQYGAGEVVLWDTGFWIPVGDAEPAYRKGHLKFALQGEKLSGVWALVRMGPARKKKENWLLIKENDEEAKSGKAANITALRPESVLSLVLAQKKHTATATASVAPNKKQGKAIAPQGMRQSLAGIPSTDGAIKKKMPNSMKPQLAALADSAPAGRQWILEIKFDGYRALARKEGNQVRLYSRSGNDWTKKWQVIADALSALGCQQAWLDGEVVAVDAQGNISFQALQSIANDEAQPDAARLAYYVFDILYLNGYDLSAVPQLERKLLLQQLLAGLPGQLVLYSEHLGSDADADAVLQQACAQGLEGIIVKNAEAHYQQSRNRNWLKLKCRSRQEFVIGGYTDPGGSREEFGAILVGVYDADQQLRYAGRVGTGFNRDKLTALKKQFTRIGQTPAPFANPPEGVAAQGVHWVKPVLVVEIEFAEWTATDTLRQASFIALRNDKPARDIVKESALKPKEIPNQEKHMQQDGEQEISVEKRIAGVKLTHPDRPVFADPGLSKLDLAHYYDTVHEWILPHLKKRPLTIVRCPQGNEEKCFFQKHAADSLPKEIRRIEVPEADGAAMYMMASDLASLVALVQIGALELHTWGSHQRALMKPDRLIFDLDPAPGLPWPRTVEAAQLMRGMLQEVGLQSFVKTTGGKGLHVVAPITPGYEWDEVKAFARAIAEHMAQTLPDRFTANMRKSSRAGKIFIDYLRNAQGATAVAAYSPRVHENAPVSTPLSWDELGADVHSDTFTVKNLPRRLQQLRQDPWKDYFTLKQKITGGMIKLFKRTGAT
ncbi:MAG: DNA ligase D [Pseudomonadota bacterium]